MTKRFATGLFLSLSALGVQAQWTAQDSLNLKRILDSEEQITLDKEALKLIEWGKVGGTPEASTTKNWMLPDESLPSVLPEKTQKKEVILTLYPYKPTTRFDWDPVYQRKIKVDKDTWRGERPFGMKILTGYTNQKKHPMNGSLPLRGGVTVNGGVVSGLDLMILFQKKFWSRKENKRRQRTLDVLDAYGDSTLNAFPDAMVKPSKH